MVKSRTMQTIPHNSPGTHFSTPKSQQNGVMPNGALDAGWVG